MICSRIRATATRKSWSREGERSEVVALIVARYPMASDDEERAIGEAFRRRSNAEDDVEPDADGAPTDGPGVAVPPAANTPAPSLAVTEG
jgi:hypothetical protein